MSSVCWLRCDTRDVSKAAIEEFTSYVAAKRRQHVDSTRSVSDIRNIIGFLLNAFAFQARHHLFRVFNICCLVIKIPWSNLPEVQFDLSGSALSHEEFDRCLRLVHSYVLSTDTSIRLSVPILLWMQSVLQFRLLEYSLFSKL